MSLLREKMEWIISRLLPAVDSVVIYKKMAYRRNTQLQASPSGQMKKSCLYINIILVIPIHKFKQAAAGQQPLHSSLSVSPG